LKAPAYTRRQLETGNLPTEASGRRGRQQPTIYDLETATDETDATSKRPGNWKPATKFASFGAAKQIAIDDDFSAI
jgi:hypothetical protein